MRELDFYDITGLYYSANFYNTKNSKYDMLARIHYVPDIKKELVRTYGFVFEDLKDNNRSSTFTLDRLDDIIVSIINSAGLSDKAKETNRLVGEDIDKFYKAIFEDFEYAELFYAISDTFLKSEYHKVTSYLNLNPDNIANDIRNILINVCTESNPFMIRRRLINKDIFDMIPEENRAKKYRELYICEGMSSI